MNWPPERDWEADVLSVSPSSERFAWCFIVTLVMRALVFISFFVFCFLFDCCALVMRALFLLCLIVTLVMRALFCFFF